MGYIILQNSSALLALPTEVKILLLVAIILSIVMGLIRKAERLFKFALFAGIVYLVCTVCGVI